MFTILADGRDKIIKTASLEFADFTEKMTGKRPVITDNIKNVPGDVVVMGGDGESPFISSLVFDAEMEYPELTSGGDDYTIISIREDDRNILMLAGGRPRSLMYAVYAFFELQGCSYFWDGDVIPHKDELSITGFKVHEAPRFEYRGIRYFAHRSLHRFQAEHWDINDWKHEIDWVLKKRLNMFMLRIGMDDIFQKAFPDIVTYPEDNAEKHKYPKHCYDDRTYFWSIRERGKLRKALLDYAFERDLIHPEDTGTMTHWYSRTPAEFLEKVNPDFIPQEYGYYTQPSGMVWDIRKDENIDNYFKLTQAHIDNYGKPEMFHTIGLAERGVSYDKHINNIWKLYAYRRIIKRLRKSYPDAPLLVASWDFVNNHWSYEELHKLIKLLDPKNTLIFDYTSDYNGEDNYFINWGIYQKFPWIFGIFQAFESGNDLRGNYPVIKRRLELAANDPMCKGMVIWPENSHADTLMYEFFAANAWNPENRDVDTFLPGFCSKRYGENLEQMLSIWQAFLPVIKINYWSYEHFCGESFAHLPNCFTKHSKEKFISMELLNNAHTKAEQLAKVIENCGKTLKLLAKIDYSNASPMLLRDCFDLGRTAAGRIFQYLCNHLIEIINLPATDSERNIKVKTISCRMRQVLSLLTGLLEAHEDYSLNDSLKKMKESGEINPDFEDTLKGNAENGYCRTYIYELCKGCYLDELEIFLDWAYKVSPETGFDSGREEAKKDFDKIKENFYSIPLARLAPNTPEALVKLPGIMEKLSMLAITV